MFLSRLCLSVDWGSYTDYLHDWERVIDLHPDLPVHVLTYDDLKQVNQEIHWPLGH